MTPEKPATGILKTCDFGLAKFYKVECDCGCTECSHLIEIEADEYDVTLNIYHDVHSKWWEKNRWKQLWQLLTRGYIETQTTTVLSEQTVLNYADTLICAMDDVKEFRDNGKHD